MLEASNMVSRCEIGMLVRKDHNFHMGGPSKDRGETLQRFVDRSNPGWVEAEPLESLGWVEAEAEREVWGPPR